VSPGASYQSVSSVDAIAIEVGAYILFGVLGLQTSFAPERRGCGAHPRDAQAALTSAKNGRTSAALDPPEDLWEELRRRLPTVLGAGEP
jgi:hypothetical protein